MKIQKVLSLKVARSFQHGCQVCTWVDPVNLGLNLQPRLFTLQGVLWRSKSAIEGQGSFPTPLYIVRESPKSCSHYGHTAPCSGWCSRTHALVISQRRSNAFVSSAEVLHHQSPQAAISQRCPQDWCTKSTSRGLETTIHGYWT